VSDFKVPWNPNYLVPLNDEEIAEYLPGLREMAEAGNAIAIIGGRAIVGLEREALKRGDLQRAVRRMLRALDRYQERRDRWIADPVVENWKAYERGRWAYEIRRRQVAEIEKCDVRCARCHAHRHELGKRLARA